MRIVSNDKSIQRNQTIARWTLIIGIAVLVLALFANLYVAVPMLGNNSPDAALTPQQSQYTIYSFIGLLLGYTLTTISTSLNSRYGRRPDKGLAAARVDPDYPDQQRAVSEINDVTRIMFTEWIKGQIGDNPDLLSKVIPDYPATGKRTLQDNGSWLKTLTQDHVELIRTPIARIATTKPVAKCSQKPVRRSIQNLSIKSRTGSPLASSPVSPGLSV